MTDHSVASRRGRTSKAKRGFDLVQAEPEWARTLLTEVYANRRAPSTDRVIALWGLGRLAHDGGEIDRALTTYTEGVALALDTGLDQIAAEMRVSWAVCLQAAGDSRAAVAQLDLAEVHLSGGPLGRLYMQRGYLQLVGGAREQAIESFDRGLPLLLESGDELAAARLISNRGVVHLQLGNVGPARRDFETAQALAERLGQHVLAAGSAQNMACLHGLQGRVPEALAGFSEARELYAEVGSPGRYLGDLDIDEAAVLIEAGLGSEAAAVAARVVDAARRSGNEIQLADALLTSARALLLADDAAGATVAAEDARRLFAAEDRPAHVAVAEYLLVKARQRQTDGAPVGLRDAARLRRLAERLHHFGWPVEAAEASILAARGALQAGRSALAQAMLDGAAAARRSPLARVRAEAWHAVALQRVAAGDLTGARRALAAGLRAVELYRSTLGTGELRSAAARLGAGLAELGVRLAIDHGTARQTLTWAERWRAGSMGAPRTEADVTVPDEFLADLRQARLDSDTDRVAALERQVGRLSRARAGSGQVQRRGTVRAVLATLGQRILVEFIHDGGELYAVVCRDSRVERHPVGRLDAVNECAGHLGFASRRLSMARHADLAGRAMEAFEHARVELDRLLFGQLAGLLGERPVVVIPSADLHHVLWTALPTAHRPGGLTTAPSAMWWGRWGTSDAGSGTRRARRGTPGTVLIAGPDLAHADREVAALATMIPDARVVRGAEATGRALLEAMASAHTVHLAAHGTFRADNPWFSTLLMADGPVYVHQLDGLRRVPHTVVLGACSSGRSEVLAGDELLGTSAALLGLGVRTLVAPQLPIADDAAVPVAITVHQALRNGTSPAAALAGAVEHGLRGGTAEVVAAAAAFTCVAARE